MPNDSIVNKFPNNNNETISFNRVNIESFPIPIIEDDKIIIDNNDNNNNNNNNNNNYDDFSSFHPNLVIKRSINNIMSKNEENKKKYSLSSLSNNNNNDYNNFYNNNDDDDDDDTNNNIFYTIMHLIFLCLIYIFLGAVIYISAYNKPLIKYIFITYFLSILIYPNISDYIYFNSYMIQSYTYNYIKKIGFYIQDTIFCL